MNRSLRALLVPAVAVVVGTSGFAFMASNAVPATQAGEGRADINGYVVSDVTYGYGHRGGSNPSPANGGAGQINSVSFSLNGPVGGTGANRSITTFIEQGSQTSAVEYRSCTETSPQRWTCTGTALSVQSVTGLLVSAAQ